MRQIPLRMFRSILLTPVNYYDGTPCWVWTGVLNKTGYGSVWFNGGSKTVHRVVYELLVGPVPKGLCIKRLREHAEAALPKKKEEH